MHQSKYYICFVFFKFDRKMKSTFVASTALILLPFVLSHRYVLRRKSIQNTLLGVIMQSILIVASLRTCYHIPNKNLTGHCRFVRQQSCVRIGNTRPRPGIAVVPDHGQSAAAVGARAVRRVTDEPVQHGRAGGCAGSVDEQDDRRVSDSDTRAGGLDTRTDRDQLQVARALAPFGAAARPSESISHIITILIIKRVILKCYSFLSHTNATRLTLRV